MAMYFKEGDREELLRDVSPLMAIEYLGLPTKKMGSNISILCPSPDHNDTHYGSCMVLHGGQYCKCFACGKTFNAATILMDAGGYSYYDALCTLASLSGREEEFEASKRPHKTKEEFLFKDLNNPNKTLIGIAPYSHIKNVKNASFEKPKEMGFFRDESGDYVTYDGGQWNPWADLIKNEPETAEWLIQNKCKEKLVEYEYLVKQLRDTCSTDTSSEGYEIMKRFGIRLPELISEIEKQKGVVEELYVNHGGSLVDAREMVANLLFMNVVIG